MKLTSTCVRETWSYNTKVLIYSFDDTYLRVNFNLNITSPSKHIYTNFMNDAVAKEVIEDLLKYETKYVLFSKVYAHKVPQSLQSFITLNYKEVLAYPEHVLFEKR